MKWLILAVLLVPSSAFSAIDFKPDAKQPAKTTTALDSALAKLSKEELRAIIKVVETQNRATIASLQQENDALRERLKSLTMADSMQAPPLISLPHTASSMCQHIGAYTFCDSY